MSSERPKASEAVTMNINSSNGNTNNNNNNNNNNNATFVLKPSNSSRNNNDRVERNLLNDNDNDMDVSDDESRDSRIHSLNVGYKHDHNRIICYWTDLNKYQKAIYIQTFVNVILLVTIFVLIAMIVDSTNDNNNSHFNAGGAGGHKNNSGNNNNNNHQNPKIYADRISELYEQSKVLNRNTNPKNLIVIIGDGMGSNYNNVYRIYNDLNETILDTIFERIYSTKPIQKQAPATNSDSGEASSHREYHITDSAAGAAAFASGIKTHDLGMGIDEHGMPRASILAAAKRAGKGTGIVTTKRVTDATPAAFIAQSMWRSWEYFIAEQEISRQFNGQPVIDVLFGGGLKFFQNHGLLESEFDEEVYKTKYKWNSLIFNNRSLYPQGRDGDTDTDLLKLPLLGLFADEDLPYHLDRQQLNIEGGTDYPSLTDMAMVAIDLLNTSFSGPNGNGFFAMIEGGEIDSCGHINDVSCLMSEMSEFFAMVESVMEWVANDEQTLIVILADHETGGLSIGRNDFYLQSALSPNPNQTPSLQHFDGASAQEYADNLYLYDSALSNLTTSAGVVDTAGTAWKSVSRYTWFPHHIQQSKHTATYIAQWYANQTADQNNTAVGDPLLTIAEVFSYIEENWVGIGSESLSIREKEFVNFTVVNGMSLAWCLVLLMNVRVNVGWTSHGHTSNDVSVYMYDGNHNLFANVFRTFDPDTKYHWRHLLENNEIGQLLVKILNVESEIADENAYLLQEFKSGDLKICSDIAEDLQRSANIIEWENNTNIHYPVSCFYSENSLSV